MYIDSHAHLYMLSKEKKISLEDIFCEMKKNNVGALINISGNEKEALFHDKEVVPAALKAGVDTLHSAGIHPHTASLFTDNDIRWLKKSCEKHSAVGEIGIDTHYNFSPPQTQEKVLLKMVELGIELQKPLIIHGRCGEKRIVEILEHHGLKGKKVLFHCYTGDEIIARNIINNGWHISFSGIVTFKKAGVLTSILKWIDLDRIFFETDSPFLSPHPFRGKINTPAKVKYIYEFASRLLNLDADKLAKK